MIRPDRKLFSHLANWDTEVYRSTAYKYNWYLIKEGKMAGRQSDRKIVWTRDDDDTYYVCPSCRALNRIDQRSSPLVINGPDLDANECEVCCACHVHTWFTLLGWTSRRHRGSIRIHPGKCPECREPAGEYAIKYDTHFHTGQTKTVHRKTCASCELLWEV
jgi:hypothetical protein